MRTVIDLQQSLCYRAYERANVVYEHEAHQNQRDDDKDKRVKSCVHRALVEAPLDVGNGERAVRGVLVRLPVEGDRVVAAVVQPPRHPLVVRRAQQQHDEDAPLILQFSDMISTLSYEL